MSNIDQDGKRGISALSGAIHAESACHLGKDCIFAVLPIDFIIDVLPIYFQLDEKLNVIFYLV